MSQEMYHSEGKSAAITAVSRDFNEMEEKTTGISRQFLGNLRKKFHVMKGVINTAAFGYTAQKF